MQKASCCPPLFAAEGGMVMIQKEVDPLAQDLLPLFLLLLLLLWLQFCLFLQSLWLQFLPFRRSWTGVSNPYSAEEARWQTATTTACPLAVAPPAPAPRARSALAYVYVFSFVFR